MFIARWTVDARFGHKDAAIAQFKNWKQVADKVGWKMRLLSGSIGDEARLEMEIAVESLAQLETSWAAMAKDPSHATGAAGLEPHIVSGTNRWEIFRVVEI